MAHDSLAYDANKHNSTLFSFCCRRCGYVRVCVCVSVCACLCASEIRGEKDSPQQKHRHIHALTQPNGSHHRNVHSTGKLQTTNCRIETDRQDAFFADYSFCLGPLRLVCRSSVTRPLMVASMPTLERLASSKTAEKQNRRSAKTHRNAFETPSEINHSRRRR